MFGNILAVLAEALKVWRLQKEIELKRLVLDEQEKIEKELEDLRTKTDAAFEQARSSGATGDLRIIDRLRERIQQRIEFSTFISTGISDVGKEPGNPDKRGDVQPENK